MTGWWDSHMDGWGGMGTGGAVGMLLVGLLVAALVLVVVLLVVRRPPTPTPTPPVSTRPGARGLLGERFARGDIDDEEYRRRLAVLDERP